MKKSKVGISLITLVITIVVIIILAAAVILSLGDNNPIESANKASFVSSISSYEDELNMYASNMMTKNLGEFEIGKLSANSNSVTYTGNGSVSATNVYDILTSLKDSKYKDKVVIENGKVVYIPENLSEKELEWALEENIELKGIKISTAEQLAKIGKDLAYPLSGIYELTNDIDLSSVCSATLGNWIPIGNSTTPFTGIFNGKNHKISNIYINDTNANYQALFGYVKNCTIKNLVVNGSITAKKSCSGIIAMANDSINIDNCSNYIAINSSAICCGGIIGIIETPEKDIVVSNCRNYGKITTSAYKLVGGIVGYANNNSTQITFSNCYNYGEIEQTVADDVSSFQICGICGYARQNTIFKNCGNEGKITASGAVCGIADCIPIRVENCYNSANLTSGEYVCGIINTATEIVNCYNTGNLVGNTRNKTNCIRAAGITIGGSRTKSIVNCYNTGSVKSRQDVGGIVAQLPSGSVIESISGCYNTGKITATNVNAGGIVGYTGTSFKIQDCYNVGEITRASNLSGAIIGYKPSSIVTNVENCYYITSKASAGIYGSADIVGQTDSITESEIKNSTFIARIGSKYKIDSKNVNNGYPMLSWQ